MPDIHIHRDHQLGLTKARKVALQWAEEVEAKFDMECTILEGETSDTVEFTRAGVKGELIVAADHFDLEARLGFLLGVEREVVGRDDQFALHAGADELDRVAGLAFENGAVHVELVLDLLGPLKRDLARLGQAERVVAVDVDVGHLKSSGKLGMAFILRQCRQAPDLGVEAIEIEAFALEQALEMGHQLVVGRKHAERGIVGAREPVVIP